MADHPIHFSVFDLDHTLFNCNGSYLFGAYLYRRGKLSLSKALYLLGCYAFHKFGSMSFASLHHKALESYFRKIPNSLLEQWVEDFLNGAFDRLLNPSVYKKLVEAKKSRHLIAILSNSPSFLVKKVVERFEIDHWMATTYCVENDSIVGISPICGEDKARFVESFTRERGISLTDCTVYTDHISDLPLLEIAGNKVAVRPRGRLKKICLQNGWDILN